MIPLVGFRSELDFLAAANCRQSQNSSSARMDVRPDYLIGTMIELPRAALLRGGDRQNRGILQLRHQRSDADDVGRVARRCRLIPGRISRARPDRPRSVRQHRCRKALARWCASRSERGGARTSGNKAWNLRRTWRRSGFDRLLSRARASIMFRARRSAFRWRVWRRRRPQSPAVTLR